MAKTVTVWALRRKSGWVNDVQFFSEKPYTKTVIERIWDGKKLVNKPKTISVENGYLRGFCRSGVEQVLRGLKFRVGVPVKLTITASPR